MFAAEEVDVLGLPFVDLSQKDDLPPVPGIYFAIDEAKKIRYIGLSKNLKHRWRYHHKLESLAKIPGIKIAYLAVSDSSLLGEIEVALINHFRPDLNKTQGGEPGGGGKPVPNAIRRVGVRGPMLRPEIATLLDVIAASRGKTKSGVVEMALIAYARESEVEAAGLIE